MCVFYCFASTMGPEKLACNKRNEERLLGNSF